MKHLLLILCTVFICRQATAINIISYAESEEENDETLTSLSNTNDISPEEVAKNNLSSERELNYIINNYSDSSLRNYAKSLNNMEIASAKKLNKNTNGSDTEEIAVPETLSEETLNDREKLIEYIRSQYSSGTAE